MIETMTLKSGAKVELDLASFGAAGELRRALAKEIATAQLDISGITDVQSLLSKDLNSVKNVICQLVGSEAIERNVFECMKRCRYNGEKITKDTFEPSEARGDFLPIALEVIKMNVLPFFTGLDWSSLVPAKAPTAAPR